MRVIVLCFTALAIAASPTLGQHSVHGRWINSEGRDQAAYSRYTFDVTSASPATVTIGLSSPIVRDTYLLLQDRTGNAIEEQPSEGDRERAWQASIRDAVLLPSRGPYTVIATTGSAGRDGPYLLTVRATRGDVSTPRPALRRASRTKNGSWDLSLGRNHLANPRYRISTSSDLKAHIELFSSDAHAYLFLLDSSGSVVDEHGGPYGAALRTKLLAARSPYTVVATTYHICERGTFNLMVHGPLDTLVRSDRRPYAHAYHEDRFNGMRMAYYPSLRDFSTTRADGFLQRVKNAGYNYVIGEFVFRNPSVFVHQAIFRNAFTKCSTYGLRLIPLIQMGSMWSAHWDILNASYEDNINMVKYEWQPEHHSTPRRHACHAFSFERDGIDRAFMDLMTVIREAHLDSDVAYPLEFVHLGHDEPASGLFLCIGNLLTGEHMAPGGTITRVSDTVTADVRFIREHPQGMTAGVRELLVTEMQRRIEQAKASVGDERLRVLFYGDIFDVEGHGGMTHYLWNGIGVKAIADDTADITLLPGLSATQRLFFHRNAIMLLWNYDKRFAMADGDPYSAHDAMAHLDSRGFTFGYCFEVTPGDQFPYPHYRVEQGKDWVHSSRRFRQRCVGYASVHWSRWNTENPPRCYDTIDWLPRAIGEAASRTPPEPEQGPNRAEP